VVANKYENDTAIGKHTDFNRCYSTQGQPQVVLSCNLVGDGVFWCSPTQNGHVGCGMDCKSMDWIHDNVYHKVSETGKPRMHLANNLVLPVWAPENSIILMGGRSSRT
jgi:hypothetical protein